MSINFHLHQSSFLSPDDIDHVGRDANHGREGQEEPDEMAPPRVMIIHVSKRSEIGQIEDENALILDINKWSHRQKEKKKTYDADERSGEDPAEFEPASRVVADHVVDAVQEAARSETPRNGDALEKDEPQKNDIAASVAVEQLEHVHSTLK